MLMESAWIPSSSGAVATGIGAAARAEFAAKVWKGKIQQRTEVKERQIAQHHECVFCCISGGFLPGLKSFRGSGIEWSMRSHSGDVVPWREVGLEIWMRETDVSR